MTDFEQIVRDAFAALLADGRLTFESSVHSPKDFGNAAVTLAGTNLLVRLVRDRNDTFADAASRRFANHWVPLERAIAAVTQPHVGLEGLLTPAQAADLVARNFDRLERGFSQEHLDKTLRTLASLEQESRTRVTERLFGRQN